LGAVDVVCTGILGFDEETCAADIKEGNIALPPKAVPFGVGVSDDKDERPICADPFSVLGAALGWGA